MNVKVSELGLGDVVKVMGTGGYADATVYSRSKNGDVEVWRPYVHVSDTIYGGDNGKLQLIPFIGIEDFQLTASSTVELIRKNPDMLK